MLETMRGVRQPMWRRAKGASAITRMMGIIGSHGSDASKDPASHCATLNLLGLGGVEDRTLQGRCGILQ
jgi:hypothetical protein